MVSHFKWLYYKMCALPLPEVLGDFEDAIRKAKLHLKMQSGSQNCIDQNFDFVFQGDSP